MLRPALVLCLVVAWLSAANGYVRYSLDGDDWTVRNVNGSIAIPATVPGVIHLDLLRAGLIDDPYYRFNEQAYLWIPYEPYWSFTKLFTPDASLLGKAAIELAFDGIDTIAEVTLNGQQLAAQSENMFRRLTISLGAHLLMSGQNNLTVRIHSPVLYAQAYSERYPYVLPVSDPASEIPYRNFIRKAQADFGWDWGGGFAPSGIWKHVELRAFDEAVIVDTTFIAEQIAGSSDWMVNVTAYMRVAEQQSAGISIAVGGALVNSSVQLTASDPSDGDDLTVVSVLARVKQPLLWWPVGYGNASLYSLTVTFHGQRESHTITKSVGFRHIRVVREFIPGQTGLTMYFEVNGTPVYAKGSNLVPFDTFHPRVTVANITRMMASALASHQNIIRVWGGGIFQADEVYDFADRSGILIWQEMLFACAMYSVDTFFLVNVREEVSQAVRRLASHASLAIVGGNNENEVMLNWQPETEGLNRDRYLVDEAKLYIETVRDALVREVGNTSIEYQSSSPSNGPMTTSPYVLFWGNGYDDNYGDNHWYNYDADCSDVSVFPRSRFISEFGWQSMPSFFTWQQISEPADWTYKSALSMFRQHHDGGYDQMEASIKRYFNFPNASDSVQLFNDTLYMTQVQQSYCYQQAISHWRRTKQEAPGFTQGVIYWQLNEEWQAPTWASLEVRARWKILHYTIRQVYAPNVVSGYVSPIHSPQSASLTVYVVSDTPHSQHVSVAIRLRLWSTGAVVTQLMTPVQELGPLQAMAVYNTSLATFMGSAASQCAPVTNCYIQLEWLAGNSSTGVEHNVLLGSLAPAPLVNPRLKLAVTSQADAAKAAGRHARAAVGAAAAPLVSSVTVTVSGAAPAAWVFVETAVEGWFSDNGFVLLPDAPRTLTFTGYEPFDVKSLQATLHVRSVWDVTHRG